MKFFKQRNKHPTEPILPAENNIQEQDFIHNDDDLENNNDEYKQSCTSVHDIIENTMQISHIDNVTPNLMSIKTFKKSTKCPNYG